MYKLLIIVGKAFLLLSYIIAIEKPIFAGEIRSNILSIETRNAIEAKGFIDGYQRSKSGLGQFIEAGIQKLNIVEIIEQKIYADAYLRGYLQFQIDLGEYISINKSEMYLQAIGFEDGCLRAKARLNEFPEVGINKLGLAGLRQQLIYIDAYQQGYSRWLLTHSCVPSPYN
ncbi:hypothetical protein [Dapis sp. BLCC M126]|uniref:hypothetical protein n=1 Tax=Dapis sp. BLCC M126 TaxID=3400189 RepID=UPI003CFB14DB